jgi:ABC-type polysaccharide/polyol phosphate export permease
MFFFLFTFGLSLIFSTMNVFMRDIRHIVPLILRLLFYGTPIFYAVENRVPERILDVYMFVNPLAVILNLFRSMFMNYYVPKPIHIAFALVDCILLFLVGYVFLKRTKI